MSQVYQYIELMEEIYEKDVYPEKLLGIDLAGQEQKLPPSRLREAFLPVMNRCQHITIHAGETEEVERVWEAVYYLNAERIGHGLTVKNNEELMQKIIDRGIALELCPSSNHQIVGFRTAEYPLRYYLGKGVLATLNTDNPGISRTNLTQEYLKAAQLTKGGLSILQILQVVKNGFSAAFLPLPERERLLLSVEQELYTHSIPLLQEVWKR
jgi:adenosine deaminase